MTHKAWTIEDNDAGQRFDIWLTQKLADYSRNQLQKAIKDGSFKVNEKVVKPRYGLQAGDTVIMEKAPESHLDVDETPLPAIPILFENEHVVAIDKPAGVAMHPGEGRETATIAHWFQDRYPASAHVGEDETRPGIVHRLDKNTSGVVVLAKTDEAYNRLKKQFMRRHIKKEYVALVFGLPTGTDGRIVQPLARSPKNPRRRTIDKAGKRAVTQWQTETLFGTRFALLRCFPLTGRMHQLRVHLHFLGHPIVGDELYTFKRQHPPTGVNRHMLHAEKITVGLPGHVTKTFTAPLPADFERTLQQLRDEFETKDVVNEAS